MPHITLFVFEYVWNITYHSFGALCLLRVRFWWRVGFGWIFFYKSEKCFSNYFTCRYNVTHKTTVGMGIYTVKNLRVWACFVLKAMEALPCWITQFSVQSTESRVIAPSWDKFQLTHAHDILAFPSINDIPVGLLQQPSIWHQWIISVSCSYNATRIMLLELCPCGGNMTI